MDRWFVPDWTQDEITKKYLDKRDDYINEEEQDEEKEN